MTSTTATRRPITPDAAEITPQTPVARLATLHPATIRVFQRHGIDFCCGGKRPLADACAEHGLDFEALRAELRAAGEDPEGERSWDDASLNEVIDHVLARYHASLREELPRLAAMAERVVRAHGDKHPEVVELARVFAGLRGELESHTMKEEMVLFPHVRALEQARQKGAAAPPAPFGTVGDPIRMMEDEHDGAAAALRRLRELSGDFQPPSGACPTFRGLYHGLAELEADTHRHIHLENNVLFPRAAELERELGAA